MKLSGKVKPISYLKARAPEVLRGLAEDPGPVFVTVNGEARAVLQDIASYEQTQETLALLKVLALSAQDVEAGRVQPFRTAFADIRRRVKRRKPERA
jgi:prevent-host-death family protein